MPALGGEGEVFNQQVSPKDVDADAVRPILGVLIGAFGRKRAALCPVANDGQVCKHIDAMAVQPGVSGLRGLTLVFNGVFAHDFDGDGLACQDHRIVGHILGILLGLILHIVVGVGGLGKVGPHEGESAGGRVITDVEVCGRGVFAGDAAGAIVEIVLNLRSFTHPGAAHVHLVFFHPVTGV